MRKERSVSEDVSIVWLEWKCEYEWNMKEWKKVVFWRKCEKTCTIWVIDFGKLVWLVVRCIIEWYYRKDEVRSISGDQVVSKICSIG